MTERRRSSEFQKGETPPCVQVRLNEDQRSLSIHDDIISSVCTEVLSFFYPSYGRAVYI